MLSCFNPLATEFPLCAEPGLFSCRPGLRTGIFSDAARPRAEISTGTHWWRWTGWGQRRSPTISTTLLSFHNLSSSGWPASLSTNWRLREICSNLSLGIVEKMTWAISRFRKQLKESRGLHWAPWGASAQDMNATKLMSQVATSAHGFSSSR